MTWAGGDIDLRRTLVRSFFVPQYLSHGFYLFKNCTRKRNLDNHQCPIFVVNSSWLLLFWIQNNGGSLIFLWCFCYSGLKFPFLVIVFNRFYNNCLSPQWSHYCKDWTSFQSLIFFSILTHRKSKRGLWPKKLDWPFFKLTTGVYGML